MVKRFRCSWTSLCVCTGVLNIFEPISVAGLLSETVPFRGQVVIQEIQFLVSSSNLIYALSFSHCMLNILSMMVLVRYIIGLYIYIYIYIYVCIHYIYPTSTCSCLFSPCSVIREKWPGPYIIIINIYYTSSWCNLINHTLPLVYIHRSFSFGLSLTISI